MKRYKKLFVEQFEKMIIDNGQVYEFWINPSSNEFSKIKSYRKEKELRGLVHNKKEIVYIFDTDILHNAARAILDCQDCINILVDFKEKNLFIHDKKYDRITHNKYIQMYYNGFDVFAMGKYVGNI